MTTPKGGLYKGSDGRIKYGAFPESKTTKPRVRLERHDQEDGSITYEIWHINGHSRICSINDRYDSERAKDDAEFLVKAWNKEAARKD